MRFHPEVFHRRLLDPDSRGLPCKAPGFFGRRLAYLRLALWLVILPGWAMAQTTDLTAAINAATPGTVIALAGGDYGAVGLRGIGGSPDQPVIIRSADPGDPARFSGLDLRDAENLVLENLVFDYTFQSGQRSQYKPFNIAGGQNITLRGAVFDGDVARGLSQTDDGFATGFGLVVRGVSGFVLEDSVISGFWKGLSIQDSTDITVRRNTLYGMRSDGMNYVQVERVLIAENYIHDFDRAPDSPDHADMIQFWTKDTTRPTRDVVIRDNVFNSGNGLYTQTIFMRNDMVDQGAAGPEMFYRNITITGNIIINAHLHGISVGEADGLMISNNTLIRNRRSQGEADNPARWTPVISISERSRNVQVLRNVTADVRGFEGQSDWTIADTFLIQDRGRLDPGFYDSVFVNATDGDPQDLGSFAYLPGGPLDGAGLGAPQLNNPVQR